MAKGPKPYLIRRAVALLVFLAIVGGSGYYLYRYGFKLPPFVSGLFSSSSDSTTISDVKTALGLSSSVSGYEISVSAQDGRVTLTGQVPSADVKSLAGQIASNTSGVKQVDNLITVNADVKRSATSSRVTDLELKSGLAQGIARAPELASKKIDISVDNQVVTISGTVDTQAQRAQAEQIVRSTPGVSAINNNLALANAEAQAGAASGDTNTDLAKRVEFEFFKADAFNLQTMKITADAGAVTLSGTVRNHAEQLLANRLAQGVDGVKKITDSLKIEQPAKQ
jgi:osmotically-inducible protein OsmY